MEIRPYVEGDEVKILELFQLAFGRPMSPEYWMWRFTQNPFTAEKKILLMWDQDVLAGHYAVSPMEIEIAGQRAPAVLSMTTMTHPAYGGRGVFTQLASALYDRLAEEGFGLVWGFPNNNSHYGLVNSLGWSDVATVPMLGLSASKFDPGSPETGEEAEGFTDALARRFEHRWAEVRIAAGKEFLDWRYLRNPVAKYRVLTVAGGEGAVIYKKIPSPEVREAFEIDLMEIAFQNDPALLRALLGAVLAREPSVERFNLWASIFSESYPAFERTGFTPGLPLTHFCVRPLADRSNRLSDYRLWRLNMGYSDVF